MAERAWEVTMYGIFEDPARCIWQGPSAGLDNRCEEYWERFAPADLGEYEDMFRENPLDFIDGFEGDGEYGAFAFLQHVLANTPETAQLGIVAMSDDHQCGLGVIAGEYMPWELERAARSAEEDGVTLGGVTKAIAKHAEALFGACPPFQTLTFQFHS